MNESMDSYHLSRRELLRCAILLAGGTATALPSELFAAAAEAPRFFDPPQFELLDAVCEIIIPATDTPGARGAGVPAAFDALMHNWASPQRRKDFNALLAAIDAAALAQGGATLLKLPPLRQIEVITQFDAVRYRKDSTYTKFKELVVRLYYLSDVGATQELRYEPVPGVWDPALKITPKTRAWATPK
jgi:hypothetical protein